MEAGQKGAYVVDPDKAAEVDHIFTYHQPKGTQTERYKILRDQAKELAMSMIALVPDSVEREMAILKIREGIMLANAAIACIEKEGTEGGEISG